jgi:hypothetical protein
MNDFKRINEKEIFIILKTFSGGAKEFVGAYWEKEVAKKVAAENIPNHTNFTISLHSIMLHGCMVDKS